MLKRFAALLLSIMLCLGVAVAEEGYQAEITWTLQPEGIRNFLQENFDVSESRLEGLAEELIKLVEGMKVSMTSTAAMDELYSAFTLNDDLLLDMWVRASGNSSEFTSNLLDQHYIRLDATEEALAQQAQMTTALAAVDWAEVWTQIQDVAQSWLDSHSSAAEQGCFDGDAYLNGVLRHTARFNDKDIAELLTHVRNVLDFFGVTGALCSVPEYSELISAMETVNQDAAQQNRYSYVLHRVYNADASLLGCSLIVLEGEEQVTTLSLGLGKDKLHGVWGYGLNGSNVYIDVLLSADVQDHDGLFTMTLYHDPLREGFQAVAARYDSVKYAVEGHLDWNSTDSMTAWQLEMEALTLEEGITGNRILVDGSFDAQTADFSTLVGWYQVANSYEEANPYATMTIKGGKGEVQAMDLSGMTLIDYSDPVEGERKVMEIINQTATELGVKLFKIIPSQLLIMLMY